MLRQIASDGFGTPLREALVVGIAANAVGVAFDSQLEPGIGEHDAADLGQLFTRHRTQRLLARIEENVRHVDDQPASGVASLEDGVELLQQLGAELLLFTLGLLELLIR